MTQKSRERVALFAGSFNPFTLGHASVVERSLPLFDRIIIAMGINPEKSRDKEMERNMEALRSYASRFPAGKIEVMNYSGELTVDLAARLGAGWLLRGVRSVKDFEYERELADINRRISGMETLLVFSLPEHSCISSSVVRELASYGRDVTDMLP